jgi:DNA-binding LacI/PurR family transcriptional regulator
MATGIKDIARELGVSLATVSRALADSPDISTETKERVWATAEALNYLPNLMARSLRSKKTRVVGVVVQEVASEFGAQAIRGIHDELTRCGYQMLLSSGSTSPDQERIAVSMLLERSVDGLIVADAIHRIVDALPPDLESARLPIVFVNRRPRRITAASFVEPDDVFGGYLATEHLIGHGHRRIAHLAGPTEWQASWDRLDGYRRALADYGLDCDERLVVRGDWSIESGLEATRQLLNLPEPPGAIFVANDIMAAGTIDAARERGLNPPADLALVGYDAREMSRYLRPALTTVTRPTYELGRSAASMLVEQVMKLRPGPATVAVRGRLVYRASCGLHRIEAEPTGTEDPFLCRPAPPPTLAAMPHDSVLAGLPDGGPRMPDGADRLFDGRPISTDHSRNGEP